MSQQTASQQIHPTAVVDPKAELASGVVIGPGAVVGPEVVIGENTWIGPHAVLDGRLTLGRDNKVYPGACLGLPPQDLKYRGANTEVLIGDGNTLRECVTINRATEEGEVTRIGNGNPSRLPNEYRSRCAARVVTETPRRLGPPTMDPVVMWFKPC